MLIEIKNNLQRNNIEWMKPRFESIIWDLRKQKTTKKKKESKKMRVLKAVSGTTSRGPTFTSHG